MILKIKIQSKFKLIMKSYCLFALKFYYFVFICITIIFNFANGTTLMGASSLSKSGAAHSSINSSDAHIVNPASIAHLDGGWLKIINTSESKEYHINDNAEDNKAVSGKSFSVHLVENSSDTEIPMGISYFKKSEFKFDHKTTTDDFVLNFGNFIFPKWSMGFGYNFQNLKSVSLMGNENEFKDRHFFTLGFIFTPSPSIGLSLVGKKQISRENYEGAIGIMVLFEEKLKYNIDLSNQSGELSSSLGSLDIIDHTRFSMGIEKMMSDWLVLKLGLSRSTLVALDYQDLDLKRIQGENKGLGIGFGFNGPKFQINYGMNHEFGIANSKSQSVDLSLPF